MTGRRAVALALASGQQMIAAGHGVSGAVRTPIGAAGLAESLSAICHALWLLVDADVARGRPLTSWPSLRTDLADAGATWVDREVVADGDLVTSRQPADIPAFNAAALELLTAPAPVAS